MSHLHLIPARLAPRLRLAARRTTAAVPPRAVEADARWPALVAQLERLRLAKRYSVRIVDADCGAGGFLIAAARHARMLGFTAIETRGIDGVPALIARARSHAQAVRDPAIGLVFDLADLRAALAEEADAPADILVWHGGPRRDPSAAIERAVRTAADVVIADRAGCQAAA